MIRLILIAIVSLLVQFILPWWSIALVAFMVCYWGSRNAGGAFVEGFAGIAVVWLAYAVLIHFRTEGVFTGRMGLLIIKSSSPAGMLLLTTVLGGLVGGLAGMAGYYVRQVIMPSQLMAQKQKVKSEF